jgi:anti-sigma B factor antagonist
VYLAELNEPLLAVTWEHEDTDCAVLRLRGELELCTVAHLRQESERIAATDVARVVLDLTHISFIDSAGMAALLGVYKLTRGSKDLCLVLQQGGCRRMLDRIQFTRFVPTYDTLEDALDEAA